jgi:acyl carrier protein
LPATAALIREQLEQIWLDALEQDSGDPTASFFDRGGDSLGATILLIGIKEAFGVDISLEEFFDNPTLSGLAGVIAGHRTEGR